MFTTATGGAPDRNADNAVRTLFDQCKQYDREHPAGQILAIVFHERKISPLIRCNRFIVPDEVQKIAFRVSSLESDHFVAPATEALLRKNETARQAIAAFNRQNESMVEAEVQLNLSLAALREQYKANDCKAIMLFGKHTAQSLFPKKVSPVMEAKVTDNAGETATNAA